VSAVASNDHPRDEAGEDDEITLGTGPDLGFFTMTGTDPQDL
jgi:hypothetical protein